MIRPALAFLAMLIVAPAAAAQTPGAVTTLVQPEEEIEPRTIGTSGTTLIGFSGFIDRFSSSEIALPTNYTAYVDVSRFITKRIVARFGVAGAGRFGGEEDDDLPTGPGAMAVHGFGGAHYYFTPESMVSFFAGAEYWAQITRRSDAKAGAVVGKGGLQAAVSSRASVFLEGGYGIDLTKGEDDEIVSRFVGQIGIRLKF
jgi:hypothetical protein